MKDNQIENTIKKGDNLPEIYNSNYSNINKNLQLLNNNIQNNMDIQLNNSNEGINDKSIVDNKNNFLDDNGNNINVINAGIINNEKMVGINRNYNTFINSINSKTLNTKIGNNNLYSKITNLNLNDISFNLNKPFDLINNLNFVPQIPLFINNSSINNINQFNNMNIYQNLNQRIENNFFKNNVINNMKNDDSNAFLNHLDISKILNAKNIRKNDILINDNNTINNNDKLNHILQLIRNYLFNYSTFNKEIEMSMENNIESFIDIFSQILSEINFKKNDNHLFEKLNGDNNNNSNNKKKDQKIDEGKCLLKDNPLLNIDLLMKDIIIVKENIIYELNAIKIYDEIRNEYILYLLKNLEYLYNSSSQKINQDQENSLFLNEINRSIKHLNNKIIL